MSAPSVSPGIAEQDGSRADWGPAGQGWRGHRRASEPGRVPVSWVGSEPDGRRRMVAGAVLKIAPARWPHAQVPVSWCADRGFGGFYPYFSI